jgi:pullulanase/glycogen debranching enzyme
MLNCRSLLNGSGKILPDLNEFRYDNFKHTGLDMKKIFFFLFALIILLNSLFANTFVIQWAKIQGPRLVQVQFKGAIATGFETRLHIQPDVPIASIARNGNTLEIITQSPFRLDTHYYLTFDEQTHFLQPDGILDSLYSAKPLGYRKEKDRYVFRVFAPRAKWVRLALYEDYKATPAREYPMTRDGDGVWEYFSTGELSERYYGYRLWGPQGEEEIFDSTIVVADPYSPAVVTQNHFTHPGKALILPGENFDWEDDTWLNIPHRDLVIYEMHVRDLTAHPSSGVAENLRGTYPGLIYQDQTGGINHIKRLGVNAVELLPAQDFGNFEIYYKDSAMSVYNDWNPYAFNHWGYMTSYFFAPESYYASGGNRTAGQYNGSDGRQVREFKELVKTFHRNGIAVLMDVVYNHVSQYDYNCFKYIDKFYYFRLKPDCEFESTSGCGNDFKTERPMARRLIVESVKYWMREYHIDGFRFDLGLMIDPETREAILKEAQKINPNVFITCEPWGGGYDPNGIADQGWSTWNDQIRNGFKGWNPHNDRGFIFGKWKGDNNRKSLQRYLMGSLREFGGQYHRAGQTVNYLAAHDDHTLGDFIRIAAGEVNEEERIMDLDKHAQLTPTQMKLNKLAAMALLTSQGVTMIHEGQEFARSKVIARQDLPDIRRGYIDHNSYEKDDETNWLNFNHAELNRELVDYYAGLIQLRKSNPAFRRAEPQHFRFVETKDSLLLAYELNYPGQAFFVALNGNPDVDNYVPLPEGLWSWIADSDGIYLEATGDMREGSDKIIVKASSGVILKRSN